MVNVKNYIIGHCINIVNYDNRFDETKLAEIKYGLEGLYLQLSKLIIISIIAILLNVFKELVILLLIYNIIRSTSFGLHATKSWICLVSSTLIFIGSTLLAKYLVIPMYIKSIISVILIYFIFKNSPADTKKKPIVNPKRRLFYKYCSTFIAIVFAYLSILIHNNFLSNCFILSLLVQSFMISPAIYKLFGLPYNNYLNYMDKCNI